MQPVSACAARLRPTTTRPALAPPGGMDEVGAARELDALLDILERVRASAFVLCVEPALVGLLSALAPYSTLTQHGVTALVPLTTANAGVRHDGEAVVYVTRCAPAAATLVAQSARANAGRELTAVLVPESATSVELILSKHGVLGDVELVAWPLVFVRDAAQPKLLSLFDSDSVTDPTLAVWPLVHALDSLQLQCTGAFGKITAAGPQAAMVLRLLKEKRKEHAVKLQQAELSREQPGREYFEYHFGYTSQTFSGDDVEHCVVVDRDLDLATPLLIQATYEGVLAETLGISPGGTTGGHSIWTAGATGAAVAAPAGVAKVSLRNDAMMPSIGELGFADACKRIYESAKQLQQEYHSDALPKESSSLSEIRSAVAKLGSLQATQRLVDTHAELAAAAMAALEAPVPRDAFDLQASILKNQVATSDAVGRIQDLMFRGCALPLVLRLACLLCLVRGGLKENVLHAVLYSDILRTYGYEHLQTLHYLERRGLLFAPRATSLLSSLGIAGFGAETDAGRRARIDETAAAGALRAPAPTAFERHEQDAPLAQTYSFYALNRAYQLYPNDAQTVPESVPYAGHVPLAARVAQLALGTLPLARTPLEPEFVEDVPVARDDEASRESKLRRTLQKNSPNSARPVLLVVLVGGVTYAEATAIALAVQNDARKYRVVVASNCIITGDALVLGDVLPN